MRFERKYGVFAAVILLAAVAFFAGLSMGKSRPVSEEAPVSPPPGAAAWQGNVLMEDTPQRESGGNVEDGPVFGSDIMRREIGAVTFVDTTGGMSEDCWDVSQAGDGSVMAWVTRSGELYELYIGAEGGVAAPENCDRMFQGYQNVEAVRLNGAFHTENATSMERMFSDCEKLETLDAENLTVSGVTDVRNMFNGCVCLRKLEIGAWDTSRVTDMFGLFTACKGLTELDLNGWDTGSVIQMNTLFVGCQGLTELDLSNWDTGSVTDMSYMFQNCTELTALNLAGWNLSGVSEAKGVFRFCEKLTSLTVGPGWDLSGMETDKRKDMYAKCGISGPTQVVGGGADSFPDNSPGGGPAPTDTPAVTSTPAPTATPAATPKPTPAPTATPAPTPKPATGGSVQVAKPLTAGSLTPDGAVFQDLAAYAGDRMTFDAVEKGSGSKTFTQEFKCSLKEDYSVLKAYADMLVEQYDFQLVETPYYASYNASHQTFFDFLLRYTGSETLNGDRSEGFSDAEGDIRIYASGRYDTMKGSITYNNSLTAFDDGRRYGSDQVDTSLVGASAYAGLNRQGVQYQTTDKRLTVSLGQAVAVTDGDGQTFNAGFQVSSSGNRTVEVTDAYGTVQLHLYFPGTQKLKTGQVLAGIELADDNAFLKQDGSYKNNKPWSASPLYILRGETYYSAVPSLSGEIQAANLRVMYWDEGNVAVFHVGVRSGSAPKEVEYLIAVSIDGKAQASGSDSSGQRSSGGVSVDGDDRDRPVRIRCTRVGCDDGKIRCDACDGEGGRRVYDHSTPQYDGTGSNLDKWDWEECYKCHGKGEIDCPRCGGTGWIDAN